MPEQTCRLAIASLVLGILSLPLSIIAGIPGLWFGILSLGRIEKASSFGAKIDGRGLAIAGIILSSISLIMFFAIFLLVLATLMFSPSINRDSKEDGGVVIEEIRKEGPVTIDRTEVVEREGKKLIDTVSETISIDPKFVEAARLAVNSTDLFGGLSKILGGVTNEDTARAAIPELEKLAPVLSGVQSEAAKLEGENKTAFAEFVSKNVGLLQKVIDTAMAIPGVKDLLGPVVGPMLETIKKLGA